MTKSDSNMLFELRKVCKSFGKEQVLKEVDFSVQAGHTTVVIGPSGCGKTVLLKNMILLLRPDKGFIFFDGHRIDDRSEARLVDLRRRCGFLFQAGALFDSQTVADNVAFPLWQHTKWSRKEINRVVHEKLELVGMGHLEDRFPAELSGGQQKRVSLARAIALEPEVVLYDEPTTGLDPIRADAINELILKLKLQLHITSIVVTHDMNSAYKIADRIVMLNEGKIIADGNVEQIRSSSDERVQRFIQGRSEGLNHDK